MPDTFYTASPHWGWYIVFYFFLGGIAGGGFFLASFLRLFSRAEDAPVVRLGYLVAVAGAAISGLLLTLDLTRPERFWHMLLQSNTGAPMVKLWSPMSVGAWGLLFFGGLAGLAALGALADEGRLKAPFFGVLARGPTAIVIAVSGSVLGLFLAGYTGVLLSVTNRPIWADSNLVGVLFLFSGVSTAAAALVLLAHWSRRGHPASLAWLSQLDRGALALELIALVAFVVSLGAAARAFQGWWGAVLVGGVVGAGIIAPLAIEVRSAVRAAALVLVGGFLLRVVVIFASDQIHVAGSGITLP